MSKGERNIKSIVEDVYEYLQDTKSLFVFDNAISYKEIENFLPSSFPIFSNREKPYVLITSSKSLFIIFSEAKQRKQERPFAG
ncbi:hypothetical protein [Wolbachia endosymbiont (group B) of Xanthorhoe designata]|uniref:hypothetical protein n=1 Tax=Wolbachia endosymbiont (group B) of Xanthorhoe designata TaxID=3066184 RepID=UPI0033427B78